MKKFIKVVVFPSIFFLAFGISAMVLTTSCKKDPGEKCSECETDLDCNDGLSCLMFSKGPNRCAESTGDLCLNFK
jgi:hypothetical protein